MKPGEVADVTRIEAGLGKVAEAYGKQGYILEHTSFQPRLDDGQRRAAFQIAVDEGSQFHMGSLEFVGITDSDATTLQKKRRLKAGDVYDASYAKRYQLAELYPLRTRAGGRASVETNIDPDRKIVNLRVVFK